ncbi:MAG: hypothetical protein JNM52_09840 [Betaproteobacteria bacterium]|nr:hypothetical protein [Betaproteobacteria bacterium]
MRTIGTAPNHHRTNTMQSWKNIPSNEHWYNTSRSLTLLGTTAIAWIPLPLCLFLQYIVSWFWLVAFSLIWWGFWSMLHWKGLTLDSAIALFRRKFQGKELHACRERVDEF